MLSTTDKNINEHTTIISVSIWYGTIAITFLNTVNRKINNYVTIISVELSELQQISLALHFQLILPQIQLQVFTWIPHINSY